jgi:hypothetical protein
VPDIVQPVAEILQQFALLFLTPQLQPEILEGTGSLPRYDIATSPLNYGVYLTEFEIPPNLGRTAAVEPDYFETLVKLSFRSRFANQQLVTVERVYLNHLPALVRIPNLAHAQCVYEILPGVRMTWSYLVVASSG